MRCDRPPVAVEHPDIVVAAHCNGVAGIDGGDNALTRNLIRPLAGRHRPKESPSRIINLEGQTAPRDYHDLLGGPDPRGDNGEFKIISFVVATTHHDDR